MAEGAEADLPGFVILLFPLVFVGFWVLITVILAKASGWSRLETTFPDRIEQPIQRIVWQSGQLGTGHPANPWGSVSYSGCLTFEVCPTGLRVRLWKIFGPFQSPFFVPWMAISPRKTKLLFLRYVALQLGAQGEVKLTVTRRAYARIAESSPLPDLDRLEMTPTSS